MCAFRTHESTHSFPGSHFLSTIAKVAMDENMPATERVQRMETNGNNLAEDIANEENCEQAFDFWSDAGARLFNEILDEGSAYLAANPHSIDGYREDSDGEECECLHTDLCEPEEETLSRGEMEIFETSYIS